jgi:hypothetical protein
LLKIPISQVDRRVVVSFWPQATENDICSNVGYRDSENERYSRQLDYGHELLQIIHAESHNWRRARQHIVRRSPPWQLLWAHGSQYFGSRKFGLSRLEKFDRILFGAVQEASFLAPKANVRCYVSFGGKLLWFTLSFVESEPKLPSMPRGPRSELIGSSN